MHFRPGFHQTPLAPWKHARYELDRIQGKDRSFILVIRVEVGQVVRPTNFHVHPDDDSKEAA
jgi:hypothetical protein